MKSLCCQTLYKGTLFFAGDQSAATAIQDRALLYAAGLAKTGGAKSGVLPSLLHTIKTEGSNRTFQSSSRRASQDV